jgi:RNase H-fold protein (predicted Holliday junction resolvase)
MTRAQQFARELAGRSVTVELAGERWTTQLAQTTLDGGTGGRKGREIRGRVAARHSARLAR